ncbi:Fic family protein [Acidisphaera sp. S103]|uniref:Fic family protein n=1 Tax=Acidisphaera sp. S103 TaxID=1747223 RepID=UPI00131C4625|nr:Fic family protein [Acidisphaera sp. S103]
MPEYPTRLGRYEATAVDGEMVRAYVPVPLPPIPPVDLSGLHVALELANQTIGRLDGIASVLPDPSLFLYIYIRKEALLSSQIEGTQSSLSDLLLYEAEEVPGVPIDDTREVSNYVAAMSHGLSRLREDFPLSLRLIREIHEILLSKGRGQDKDPGEFRRSQNWIGGTRPGNALFVPPPPHLVMDCLGALETFIHTDTPDLPLLVKAALVHVQFETIHPFLDSNGRLGRLLITFLMCERGILREPLLYLSLFFKQNRQAYYEHLQAVRQHGAWEAWVEFFLRGVTETARQGIQTAQNLLRLFGNDHARIEQLGRPAATALRLHQFFQRRGLTTIPAASRHLGLSQPTVTSAIAHLRKLGIVRETTGRLRGKVFVYGAFLDLLSEGTDPLPR